MCTVAQFNRSLGCCNSHTGITAGRQALKIARWNLFPIVSVEIRLPALSLTALWKRCLLANIGQLTILTDCCTCTCTSLTSRFVLLWQITNYALENMKNFCNMMLFLPAFSFPTARDRLSMLILLFIASNHQLRPNR